MAAKKAEQNGQPATMNRAAGRGQGTEARTSPPRSRATAKKADKPELEQALSDCWDAMRAQLALRELTLSLEGEEFWRDWYAEKFAKAIADGKHWTDADGKDKVIRQIARLVKYAGNEAHKRRSRRIVCRDAVRASLHTDCGAKLKKGQWSTLDFWCTA